MYDVPSCRVVEINLGCGIKDRLHKHRVYVTTFLGYGANEVLRKYMTKRKLEYQKYPKNRCTPLRKQEQILNLLCIVGHCTVIHACQQI